MKGCIYWNYKAKGFGVRGLGLGFKVEGLRFRAEISVLGTRSVHLKKS